jgi:hypothetical protein
MRAISRNGLLLCSELLIAALVMSGCRPHSGRWSKLAEVVNTSGERFILAQEHYEPGPGWRVAFFAVTPEHQAYGSLLQMNGLPWLNSRILLSTGQVTVVRGTASVGVLNLSTRRFTNLLNGVVNMYTPDNEGAHINQSGTKFYFDQ